MTQRIELDRIIINTQEVSISSSSCCTSFVSIKRCPALNVDELLERYQRIVRQAKSKSVKLVLRKKPQSMKARILEMKDTYPQEATSYNVFFDTLVSAWIKIVQSGLYKGYGDDPKYLRAVALSHQIMSMTSHSEAIGKAIDINNELNHCLQQLQNLKTTAIAL